MSLHRTRWSRVAGVASLLLAGCATYPGYEQPYYEGAYTPYRSHAPSSYDYGRDAAYERGYRDAERARSSQPHYYDARDRDYERGYERGKKEAKQEAKREAKERNRERTDYRPVVPVPSSRPSFEAPPPAGQQPARGTFGANDG